MFLQQPCRLGVQRPKHFEEFTCKRKHEMIQMKCLSGRRSTKTSSVFSARSKSGHESLLSSDAGKSELISNGGRIIYHPVLSWVTEAAAAATPRSHLVASSDLITRRSLEGKGINIGMDFRRVRPVLVDIKQHLVSPQAVDT